MRNVFFANRMQWRNIGHTGKAPMPTKRKNESVTSSCITAETVGFKPGINAKASGSWKYQGGVVDRVPDFEINGTYYSDHKRPHEAENSEPQPRRKQESSFLLTLNSNFAPQTHADVTAVMNALDAMSREMAKEEVMATYFKFGPVTPHYRGDLWKDVVTGITSKWGAEVGPKLGRCHVHAIVTIEHCSQLQVDPHMMQVVAKAAYNEAYSGPDEYAMSDNKNFYVHAKLLPQSAFGDVIKRYLHKGIGEAE
jgi:hypothetical protein